MPTYWVEAIFYILIWDCGTGCVKKIFYLCVCVCVLVLPPARELLNSGVSPDLVNEDGLTALHQVNKKHSVDCETPESADKILPVKHVQQ